MTLFAILVIYFKKLLAAMKKMSLFHFIHDTLKLIVSEACNLYTCPGTRLSWLLLML